MLKLIVIATTILYGHALCSVSHEELWNCALGTKCLNKYRLHSIAKRHRTSTLQQPFIMAIEGPQYHRLYEECDTNKDGCIDIHDIESADSKCQRSCLWRQTMKNMLCHT
jgi:hypothetical protein